MKPHLSQLKADMEAQLNWGPAEQWTNREYEELSSRIHEKTGVVLSYTTLKRILGKIKYENSPSITSLDAMAQFLGKESWRNYYSKAPKTNFTISKRVLIPALVVLVGILGFALFYPSESVDPMELPFKSRIVAEGYPNTVMFDLDMPEELNARYSIQLFWDPERTVELKGGQQSASGIYYYPGYFRAKLLQNDRVLKQHDVYLKAEDWMATIDESPVPYYVSDQIIREEGLSISDSIYEKLRSFKTPSRLTYHWVQPTGISADNFELNTKVKHTLGEGAAVCQTFRILVLGTKSAIIVPFTKQGCVSEIGVMLSEKFLDGRENDLSNLAYDPQNEASVTLKNINQELKVYLDGEEVYTLSYENSLGEIAGLRFAFTGAGEVQTVDLRSLEESEPKIINPIN